MSTTQKRAAETGAEQPAAKRRTIKGIQPPKQPFLESTITPEKLDFAVQFIAEEVERFGKQEPRMDESNFEGCTRSDISRLWAASGILKGLLIRGRLQTAVFNIFLELCAAGVCSLDALQHPVKWYENAEPWSCLSWIGNMLSCFTGASQDWGIVQSDWGMERGQRWFEYRTPIYWLRTMIARSFTSLPRVFEIIRRTQQLGPLDDKHLQWMIEKFQPNPTSIADMDTNRGDRYRGSETFAFWLPENVDIALLRGEGVAGKLSHDFLQIVDKMETHYCAFFDVDRETLDEDMQDGEEISAVGNLFEVK